MSQQQYKHYARAATHAKFTAILGTLPAALTPTGGVPPTTKDLARLVEKLQRLQQLYFEDHAEFRSNGGAHQPHPLPFPRIPTKLFKNYSPGGSLQRIIHSAFTYRIKKAFRKWDVDNPAKKALFEDMLRYIAEDLSSCGMIADPVLAFASDVPLEVRAELAPLATLMRAKVVSNITPSVTHVLHHAGNDDDNGADDEEGEWYRTLEKQDGHVLLHYWYKPDSADVWVPETSGDYLDPEPAPVHQGPWFLSTRWLKDSYKFLEWANEEDYERAGGEAGNGDSEADGRESAAATPRKSSAPATVNGEDSDDAPSDDDEEGEDEGDEEDDDDEDDDEDEEEEEEGDDAKSRKSHDDDRPRHNSMNTGGREKEQVSEQGGLKSHPFVRVVDLNQKGTRIRRYEYEPFKNAVLHNMSWTVGATMPTGVASYAGDRRANPDQAWEFLQAHTSQSAIAVNSQGSTLPAAQPDAPNDLSAPASSPAPPPPPPPPPSGEPYTETPAELATHRIVNLAHAPWFAFDSVHPCEKLHFPEFFNEATTTGSQLESSSRLYPPRSAGAYLHIRNSLIVAFRRNMTQYLGIEEACRRLGERVEDVAKVLRFLTHWGLINLQISESAPTGVSQLQAGRLRYSNNSSDPSGKRLARPHTFRPRTVAEHRQYVYASPISKSPPLSPPPDAHHAAPTTFTSSSAPPSPAALASALPSSTSSAISSSLSLPQLPHTTVPSCETCLQQLRPQAPHYVLSCPPNVVLCHDCFAMGRYPFTLSSRDFIRVEPIIPHPTTAHPHELARFQIANSSKNSSARKAANNDRDGDASQRSWSERETLQLLDAVARFAGNEPLKQEPQQQQSYAIKADPDVASPADSAAAADLPIDWDQVAKQVPPRTREECLARFLNLHVMRDPPLLSDDNSGGDRAIGYFGSSSNDCRTSLSPLETSANPVMHLVAAVAAAINPGIAAECAKHALAHLAKMNGDDFFSAPLGGSEEHCARRRKREMEIVGTVVREAAAPAARRLACAEDQELEILARALADAQLRKMELKMAGLKEVK